MKNYEVIVERRQPTCGGKSPKDVKMLNVITEDPAEYVKEQEQVNEVTVTVNPDGEIVVEAAAKQVRYSFTED